MADGGVSLADRYAGCLLGLASGDALGAPVEFCSREEIKRDYPDGLREFVGGGWLAVEPGEITDDTQLTLALARSLTAQGWESDRFGADLLAWYRSQPKDIGTTTRLALDALAQGESPATAGAAALDRLPAGQGASNGAVMRCAPVALRFRHDPRRMVEVSLASAAVTHAEPRAAWATVAVNQALVHLLGGGDRRGAIGAAVDGVDNTEVRACVGAALDLPAARVRGRGFVLDTIQAAFWALTTADSAEAVIVQAVSLGDDADTTGAVAGALAGAHWGRAGLPQRWLSLLQPRAKLEDHAARLLALSEGERGA